MNKKTVCVLFGGQSPEHDVSLNSSSFVIENIDESVFELLKVGITRDGQWFLYEGPVESIRRGTWLSDGKKTPAFLSPDRGISGLVILGEGGFETRKVDCAFPVLHGKYGEDGTIQGLLSLAGIPCVGCPMAASAIAMDKVFSRTIFDAHGIPQAPWIFVKKSEFESNLHKTTKMIEDIFEYPIFIKPANAGSSVGVSKAKDEASLIKGLSDAFLHDEKAVIETFIDGREIEISVLGNDDPTLSVCGEIVPTKEFYDYEAKYHDASSKLILPAEITEAEYETIKDYAMCAFSAIDGRGMSRIDFFIRRSDGKVFLNEINTIPGFTAISMYPKLLSSSGIDSKTLVTRLIKLSLEI